MNKTHFILLLSFLLLTEYSFAQDISLTTESLEPVNVKVEETKFKGRKAIRLTGTKIDETIAIIKNSDFKNGIIELDVAGQPMADANASFRGFIGLAFRVKNEDTLRYECFYIRPTNGRADDQVRRNQSTQYISHPTYTWDKLRDEFPGMYESYTDLVPGEWTKIKIEVQDDKARLFVNGADQPCLIVNDLKYGLSNGSIALWIGIGTDGYFSNLNIQPK